MEIMKPENVAKCSTCGDMFHDVYNWDLCDECYGKAVDEYGLGKRLRSILEASEAKPNNVLWFSQTLGQD